MGEEVDDVCEVFVVLVEGVYCGVDCVRVFEVWYVGRVEEFGEDDGVVEGYGYVVVGKGMVYVYGVF